MFTAFFSVNFHFLKNDKSYNWDFFTINTIDHGLSFDRIESVLSSDFFCLVLHMHRILCIRQSGRIRMIDNLESILMRKSISKCIESRFQKFVILNFGRKPFLTIFCYLIRKSSHETIIVFCNSNISLLWTSFFYRMVYKNMVIYSPFRFCSRWHCSFIHIA
jgi:hypothetical protein